MATKDTFTVLVGNKTDLVSSRQVTKAEAAALADHYGIEYFETSAKDDIGVAQPFIELATLVRSYQMDPDRGPKVRKDIVQLTDEDQLDGKRGSSSCCLYYS